MKDADDTDERAKRHGGSRTLKCQLGCSASVERIWEAHVSFCCYHRGTCLFDMSLVLTSSKDSPPFPWCPSHSRGGQHPPLGLCVPAGSACSSSIALGPGRVCAHAEQFYDELFFKFCSCLMCRFCEESSGDPVRWWRNPSNTGNTWHIFSAL